LEQHPDRTVPNFHARGITQMPMTAAAIGSMRDHPVALSTTAALMTPMEPAASAIASV